MADEYLSEAFIKSLHAQIVEMKGDLAANTESTQQVAQDTRQNTDAIKRVAEDTQGMVEAFRALEGGFKVLTTIGRMAKPIFYIASACGALLGVWAAIKAGVLK